MIIRLTSLHINLKSLFKVTNWARDSEKALQEKKARNDSCASLP